MEEERLLRFDDKFGGSFAPRAWWEFMESVARPLEAQFAYARKKHGPGNTVQNPVLPDVRKLAILVEEVGEVAEAMQGDKQKHVATELLQVAAVALMWYDSVR